MPTNKNKHSDQADKFKRVARELGCDEDEAKFNAALRKIGKASPPKQDDAPAGKSSPKRQRKSGK